MTQEAKTNETVAKNVATIKANYGPYTGEKTANQTYTPVESVVPKVLRAEWDRANEVLREALTLPKLEDNTASQEPADENTHPERGYLLKDKSKPRKMR